jgi:hypothetical protein
MHNACAGSYHPHTRIKILRVVLGLFIEDIILHPFQSITRIKILHGFILRTGVVSPVTYTAWEVLRPRIGRAPCTRGTRVGWRDDLCDFLYRPVCEGKAEILKDHF